MSLLLKALQNAAKNREAGSAERSEPDLEPGNRRAGPAELSLEPVQPTPRGAARGQSAVGGEAGERPAAPGPQHAQSILRAGAGAHSRRMPRHEPGIFDWLARRPLVAFSTAAGLFAIGYGIYLYLQLTNPGIFIARPPAQAPRPSIAAAPPPPQPAAPRPPAAAPAPPPSLASAAPSAPTAGTSSAPSATGGAAAQAPAPNEAGAPGAPASVPATPRSSTLPARSSAPVPPQPSTAAPAATGAGGSATSARAAPERPSAVPERSSVPPAMASSAPRRTEAASPAGSIAAAPGAPAASGGAKMAAIETGTVPPATRPAAPRARPKAPAAPAAPEGVAPMSASQVVTVDRVVVDAYNALEQGRLDEAERLYRQSLASDARNVDAMLGLAATLALKHQGDAAGELYMRVLEQDPRNTHAQAGLLNLGGQADPIAAETRLKQLISAEPSAFLYFTLGNLYAERGHWPAAQGAYFQAHKLDPDNPDYAFNLAVGLEHLSQPRLALDYYRRAAALAHARGHAQFDLARVESRIRSLETTLASLP